MNARHRGFTRWAALVVGLLVVTLLAQVPFLGGFVRFLVLLGGLGALALALRAAWRARDRSRGVTATPAGTTGDRPEPTR